MGTRDSIIKLAFVCIFMGGYEALVQPLLREKIKAGGELYSWGMASALLFISGAIGLIVGTLLTRRRRHPEVV